MQITSAQFKQDVARFQDEALKEPVAITQDGRAHTVLLSAWMFELLTKGRVARRVEELDDETVQVIAQSSVAAEYAGLDDLITDWTP